MNNPNRIDYSALVDIPKLQALLEDFHQVIGIANAIIDIDGRVIAHAGWQKACTDFHRVNAKTCLRCIESDTSLVESMTQGSTYAIYNCLNGLVETAAPIMVCGQHVANIFSGQFLTAPPDVEFFRRQARQFGFDEEGYLVAIAQVPVISQTRAEEITQLYARLAATLAENGMDRLRQQQTKKDLHRLNLELEQRVRERTAELTRSEAQLRVIADHSYDWEYWLGPDRQILFMSPSCERITGYTAAEFMADPGLLERIVLPDDRGIMNDHLGESIFHEESILDFRIVRRDGQVRWITHGCRAIHGAQGEYMGRRISNRDTTERILAELELRRSNTELEQFSYTISHDMRQPLRMISSYLYLLTKSLAGQLNAEQRQYFDFAREGAQRLDQMMLALLDYSRVGRKGEPPDWIESRALLDEALQFLQPTIVKAGAQLEIVGDWPRLLVSRDEMTRLMQNLIGNALKYRIAGKTPQITVSGETAGDKWRLSVADNGIGIDPRQVGRLFQVFQRLHAHGTYPGTGIGLALCRKIAEHHGGRIYVESAGEGLGSTFRVEMPLAVSTLQTEGTLS
jgi:PAS domain S-box-containing protein